MIGRVKQISILPNRHNRASLLDFAVSVYLAFRLGLRRGAPHGCIKFPLECGMTIRAVSEAFGTMKKKGGVPYRNRAWRAALERVIQNESGGISLFHIPSGVSTVAFTVEAVVYDGKVFVGRVLEKVGFATFIADETVYLVAGDVHVAGHVAVAYNRFYIVGTDTLGCLCGTTEDTVGDFDALWTIAILITIEEVVTIAHCFAEGTVGYFQ